MKKKTDEACATNEALSALVAKAKAGDQDAFTELYDRTAPYLYRCIRAMTRDEDLTWDIQQDSYLRAFRSLDKLENNDVFFPWLRRIAVNITATQMKQRIPMTFTEFCGDDEDAMPELPDLNADTQPELSLDQKETTRLVQEILSTLPEEQQLIVGMRYYDELSVKEIAKTLHISTGTVKAQLFHGRKKIESAVRGLERQGVKLYGLSPLPFLLALMRNIEPAQAARAIAVKTVVAKAATEAVAVSATPVSALTFGQMLHGSIAKILIGALSVATIGGGIWAGAKLLNRDQPIVPNQPTETAKVVLLRNHNGETLAATPEDLTEPLAYEIVSATEPEDSIPPTETTEQPTEPTKPANPTKQYESFGTCGEHLTWRFDPETGLLTIEGNGMMDDAIQSSAGANVYDMPWSHYRDAITEVVLSEDLTSIGSHAFSDCSALRSVIIPDQVSSIGESAFLNCDSLRSASIGKGVNRIGSLVFYGCTSLMSVEMSNNIFSIDEAAFYGCKTLSDITLPENVTEIGHSAFFGCKSLKEITIPASVKSIYENAFLGCDSLKTVKLLGKTLAINEYSLGYASVSKKLADCVIYGYVGSTAEQYAKENSFSFVALDSMTGTSLDTILARMAQDDAERAKLSGDFVADYGGHTVIDEISKVGDRYLAKLVRSVAVTANEVELEQARQTGHIVLLGKEYRYTDSQEQLDEWLDGTVMQGNIPVNQYGILFTEDYACYDVCKVGNQYIFIYAMGAGGPIQKIQKTTNEDLVWLDGDMPLVLGPSLPEDYPDGGYTLASYLQNHSITAGTTCRIELNDKNEPYIYVDIR